VNQFAGQWLLDPEVDFLNHGSFGACPRVVLEEQSRFRSRLEQEPVRFMMHELEPALDVARSAVARLVGADPEDLAFVSNATTGVNTVLASFDFRPGDEVLVTDHGYGACTNAARYWTARAGASVTTVPVSVPVTDPEHVVQAVLAAVTPRTRLALVDHVTSATGLVLPVERLVRELRARGVKSLVDGAHAPGMLLLDLRQLGADYYAANLHKWCCTPKGSAILVAGPEQRETLRPLVISHGAAQLRRDRSRFRLEFDYCGTTDPSAVLAAPRAIEFLSGLLPGGLPALMAHNRALAIQARSRLLDVLGGPPICPESMLGSLATVLLPDAPQPDAFAGSPFPEPLYSELVKRRFQVFTLHWPERPRRVLRITAQIYNEPAQYERLATVLGELVR
jgi:isopenicillin-N epimerase